MPAAIRTSGRMWGADGKLHDITADAKILYSTCQGLDGFRVGLRFIDTDPARSRLIESLY